ncbi:xylose isomerase-like protein [Xylariaceae sp. FL0594]|nr:xylose isomerase-like protein [Xylariaceae sp. FL0594]
MPPRQSSRLAKAAVAVQTSSTEVAVKQTKTNGAAVAARNRRVTTKREVVESIPEPEPESEEEVTKPPATSRKRKAAVTVTAVKTEAKVEDEDVVAATEDEPKAAPKKRRTAKTKTEDLAPLAERTAIESLKKAMYIGAHVSSAGGVHNSITNTVHIGANAFALFLKSQRKWANPPMAPEARDGFRALSETHKFEVHKHCLPHGSYLVNLAQAEAEKAEQAYAAFVDDLERCEALGIRLYNFHPGNTNGDDRSAAIARIAAQLNRAHAATHSVVTVLENMAGQGNVIGCSFEDLRDIIRLVDDKARVGVCIDTCHAFAAGYDLRSPETFASTMARFDAVVGIKPYLKALHINDSKAPFNSHRDLHANIGTGFLGLRAFHNVMNCDDLVGLPMVLETPIERPSPDGKGGTVEDKQVWADEIKLLESLIGMDVESDVFKALEERLQKQGEAERAKIQDQVDRKSEKDAKKAATAASKAAKGKAKGKGKKKKKAESDEEEEEESE